MIILRISYNHNHNHYDQCGTLSSLLTKRQLPSVQEGGGRVCCRKTLVGALALKTTKNPRETTRKDTKFRETATLPAKLHLGVSIVMGLSPNG